MSPIINTGACFWRQSGINYLQYLGICSKAVTNALKEPSRSRAIARSGFSFNKAVGTGDKFPVSFNA